MRENPKNATRKRRATARGKLDLRTGEYHIGVSGIPTVEDMSSSMVRGALIGAAGIVATSIAPWARAEGVRIKTGERVELCIAMTGEDGDARASVSVGLHRMMPDSLDCEVGIRANTGMGAADVFSGSVPEGQYAYVNVFGMTGVDEAKTITGACTTE